MAAQWGNNSLAPGASQGWFFARPYTPGFLPVLQVVPLSPSDEDALWSLDGDGFAAFNQLGVSNTSSQLSDDLSTVLWYMVVENRSSSTVEYAFLETDQSGPGNATPPSPLGGSSNYYFYAGTAGNGSPIPIEGIVVTIEVTEDLVGTPPFSLQLNAWSPSGDLDNWQQYGISMAPGSNQLNSFAENWPASGNNLFNIEPNGFITLPNETTIPKGYKIVIELTYMNDNTGNVNGSVVTVFDESGTTLGSQTITLIGQALAAGGTITEADLAPIASFQLVLVGWANYTDTSFSAGAGTIIYQSSTLMAAEASNPSTGENANSIYGVLPATTGTFFAQPFGVDSSKAPAVADRRLHGRPSRFAPGGLA
jgi:hypothetical protein